MHDAVPVRLVEGAGDLDGGPQGVGKRQRALREPRGQRLALEVLHDEELDLLRTLARRPAFAKASAVRRSSSGGGRAFGANAPLGRRSVGDAKAPDVIQGADVGVRQLRDALGFPIEAVAELRVRGEKRGQHLDGNVASEAGVAGFVDLAHSAGAEGLNDFVGTESGTRS